MTLRWFKFLCISASRNLWRAPRRTVFSLLAIASAVCSLLLFGTFVDGVKHTFRENLITSYYGHFQVYKHGYLDNRSDNPFGYQIQELDGIKKLIDENTTGLALFSRRQPFFALLNHNDRSVSGVGIGTDPIQDQSFLTLNKVVEGKHLAQCSPDAVFIGAGLAKSMHAKPGDNITLLLSTAQGSMNAKDLEVCGIFKSGVTELDNVNFYLYIETVQKLLRVQGVPQILIGLNDRVEPKYIPKLKEAFKATYPDLEIVHWHELAGEMYDNGIGWLEKIFSVFQIIVLTIATLSIVNVFTISLLERTGEFGTLRAIGTYPYEITLLIFVESIFQGVLGGFIGIVLAFLISTFFLRAGISMPPPTGMTTAFHVNFVFPWNDLGGIFGLCLAVSIIAGIFPALKIRSLNIVLALGRNV